MVTITQIAKECGITRQGIDRRIKSLKITPKYLNSHMRIISAEEAERLKSFSSIGRPKNKLK